jgi:hypothetical protein
VVSRVGNAEESQDGENKLTMFWPEVEYEYEPGGGKLTGNRISMASIKTSVRAEIEKKIAVYPVGKNITVFYNASDLTDAYLKDPKRHIGTFLLTALSMMVFGGLMNWMIWSMVP